MGVFISWKLLLIAAEIQIPWSGYRSICLIWSFFNNRGDMGILLVHSLNINICCKSLIEIIKLLSIY